ncbi:hypothetical protein [Candidatus Viridilinea mediisalina]|nr:hypothetical protein [Candidatus Viridilinea mediisalina]
MPTSQWAFAFLLFGGLTLATFLLDAALPRQRLYAVAWQVPLLAASWF